jgi:hypothetical protein
MIIVIPYASRNRSDRASDFFDSRERDERDCRVQALQAQLDIGGVGCLHRSPNIGSLERVLADYLAATLPGGSARPLSRSLMSRSVLRLVSMA